MEAQPHNAPRVSVLRLLVRARKAERRAATAERERDLYQYIAATAMKELTPDQRAAVRKVLAEGGGSGTDGSRRAG